MHTVLYDLIVERRLPQLMTMWLGAVMFSSALSENTTMGIIANSPRGFNILLTFLAWAAFCRIGFLSLCCSLDQPRRFFFPRRLCFHSSEFSCPNIHPL